MNRLLLNSTTTRLCTTSIVLTPISTNSSTSISHLPTSPTTHLSSTTSLPQRTPNSTNDPISQTSLQSPSSTPPNNTTSPSPPPHSTTNPITTTSVSATIIVVVVVVTITFDSVTATIVMSYHHTVIVIGDTH
jgi:hypothetical protein